MLQQGLYTVSIRLITRCSSCSTVVPLHPQYCNRTTTAIIMTKEEFAALQLSHRESGKTLKEFLKDLGVGYSTYNYWRKKFLTEEEPHELAPISFQESSHHQSSSAVFSGDLPSGATLLFPNGLRAHFGTGTESMLMELLEKSLVSHVLP